MAQPTRRPRASRSNCCPLHPIGEMGDEADSRRGRVRRPSSNKFCTFSSSQPGRERSAKGSGIAIASSVITSRRDGVPRAQAGGCSERPRNRPPPRPSQPRSPSTGISARARIQPGGGNAAIPPGGSYQNRPRARQPHPMASDSRASDAAPRISWLVSRVMHGFSFSRSSRVSCSDSAEK